MDIQRLYFIVHPAFCASNRSTILGYTASELSAFIRELLHPVLLRAARDPHALLFYFKSRPPKVLEDYGSRARLRRLASVEDQLEQRVHSAFEGTDRAIVVGRTVKGDDVKAAARQVVSRGHVLSPNALLISHGAWRELCVRQYPLDFAARLGIRPNLLIPTDASIKARDSDTRAIRKKAGRHE